VLIHGRYIVIKVLMAQGFRQGVLVTVGILNRKKIGRK